MAEEGNNIIDELQVLFNTYFEARTAGKTPDFLELEYIIMERYAYSYIDTKVGLDIAELGLAKYPDSITLKLSLARKYVRINKLDKAKKLIVELEFTASNSSELNLARGEYLIKTGETDKGLAEFQLAIDLADERQTQINAITEFGQMKPGTHKADILYEVGSILNSSIMPDKAIQYLEQGIKLAAGKGLNNQYKMMIAACHMQKNNSGKAIQLYNEILDQSPFFTIAWHALAEIYIKIEDFDNAIKACEYVLAIDEKFWAAYYLLSKAYTGKNNPQKAIEMLTSINGNVRDKENVYTELCTIYRDICDYENEEKTARKIIDIDPDNLNAHVFMCDAMFNTKQWEEVIFHAEILLNAGADEEGLFFCYAVACYNLDEYNKVIELLERLLQQYPDFPDPAPVYLMLWNSYNQIGNEQMTRKYIKKAQEIDPEIESPFGNDNDNGNTD